MTYGGRVEAFFTVPSTGNAIAVTTNAGAATFTWAAGSYTPSSAAAYLQTSLNTQAPVTAGTWTVTLSTGSSGTGKFTLSVSAGTFSITWTSTALRDVLGFTATITTQSSATATTNARGLWLPDCPVDLDGDPDRAPEVTDSRSTESPTGGTVTLGGNTKYVHKNLRWSHLTRAKVYEGAASVTYSSLQQWFRDTQFNSGHAWFSRGSAFHVYWDNAGTDRILGYDLNSGAGPASGWTLSPAIATFEPQKVSQGWIGMWSFVFPRLVSEG